MGVSERLEEGGALVPQSVEELRVLDTGEDREGAKDKITPHGKLT